MTVDEMADWMQLAVGPCLFCLPKNYYPISTRESRAHVREAHPEVVRAMEEARR